MMPGPLSRLTFRHATLEDVADIDELIRLSARTLGPQDYTHHQIELALERAFGVDTNLIKDGTYFVAEDAYVVACGGWSYRTARFGSDVLASSETGRLDPQQDAARIRAFFVHPGHARRGIGKRLLELCEAEAVAAGFRSAELMATLGGQRFYASAGYLAHPPVFLPLSIGLEIEFVPMSKSFV